MKHCRTWLFLLGLGLVSAQTFGVNPEYAMTLLSRLDEKSGPISMIVTVTVQNGKQKQFEALLPELKTRVETEKGYKMLASAKRLDSSTQYAIYSVWETVADLKVHLLPTTNADLKEKVQALTNGPALEAIDVIPFGEFN